MSHDNSQKSANKNIGCFFGVIFGFIGALGALLIIALLAGVTINQFNQMVDEARNPQEAVVLEDEGAADEQPAASASEAGSCNATQYLQVTGVVVTEQYTNESGTRICNYTLGLKSVHPTDPIRYFYHRHSKDVYQGTENYQWMGNFPLAPFAETEWFGNIAIYNEKDAQGPVMSIPVKVAGIFDTPECSVYFKDAVFDEAFLESIAFPVSSPCPLE